MKVGDHVLSEERSFFFGIGDDWCSAADRGAVPYCSAATPVMSGPIQACGDEPATAMNVEPATAMNVEEILPRVDTNTLPTMAAVVKRKTKKPAATRQVAPRVPKATVVSSAGTPLTSDASTAELPSTETTAVTPRKETGSEKVAVASSEETKHNWAEEVEREKRNTPKTSTTTGLSTACPSTKGQALWNKLHYVIREELLHAGLRQVDVERRFEENKCGGCGAISHKLFNCKAFKIPGRAELVPRKNATLTQTATPDSQQHRQLKRPREAQTPSGVTPPAKVVRSTNEEAGVSYAEAAKRGTGKRQSKRTVVAPTQTSRSKYAVWVTHDDTLLTNLSREEFESLMQELNVRSLEEEDLPQINGHFHSRGSTGFFTDDVTSKAFLDHNIAALGYRVWQPEALRKAREPMKILTGYVRRTTGSLKDEQLQQLITKHLRAQELEGAMLQSFERIKSGGVLVRLKISMSCYDKWCDMSPPLHLRVGMEGYVRFVTRDEWKQIQLAGRERVQKGGEGSTGATTGTGWSKSKPLVAGEEQNPMNHAAQSTAKPGSDGTTLSGPAPETNMQASILTAEMELESPEADNNEDLDEGILDQLFNSVGGI